MWLIGAILCLGALCVGATQIFQPFSRQSNDLVFHTVQKGPLLITVTERGNLESQQNLKVFCEVDDIGGDNIDGTAILETSPAGHSRV